MATNAHHQANFRARQISAGSVRLDTHISAEAAAVLSALAQRERATVRSVVESAILNQATGTDMKSQFRHDDPRLDAGHSKPVMASIRLTAEELAPSRPVSQPPTPRQDATPMTMTTTQPARPSRMTDAERVELEQFKNSVLGARQDARRVQINGGAAAIDQKARVTESLLANNIHHRPKN